MATSVGKRRKQTFHSGDRVIGRESARASFRFRHGTVVEGTHNSSEFYVSFDDRPDEPEAVFTWWIENKVNCRHKPVAVGVDMTREGDSSVHAIAGLIQFG